MQHFYDAQIRRYILQFIRMMSNFTYITGKNSKGVAETLQVPVKYGDMSKQVAAIIRKGSENTLIPAPQVSAYITDLRYDRERIQNPYHVDKKHVRERAIDPSTGEYTGEPGQAHTIERIMPTPFELTFRADIFTTNTDQKLQILEQILVLFNPALELQTTDNYLDWTSLSFVELTNIDFSSRAIPQGIADEIDVASLTFRTPIWLSPPAKLKKLGVIEKIIMSIYDEDAGIVDVDGILGDANLISRQYVTPGQYALLVLGNRVTLLGQMGSKTSHTDNRDNQVFASDTQYGNKTNWLALEALYSKEFRGGLSTIQLQQSATTLNGDDIIVDVTGTIALDPQDEFTMLITIDEDTTPTNTINAVDAVINPTRFDPTNAPAGTRYLLTDDIGDRLTDTANKTTPWGTLVAQANDIVEKVGSKWIVDFNANSDDSTQLGTGLLDSSTLVDSTQGMTGGDSSFTKVQYVTNITTGIQYKWTGSIWIKSYEGFYEPGTWSITF